MLLHGRRQCPMAIQDCVQAKEWPSLRSLRFLLYNWMRSAQRRPLFSLSVLSQLRLWRWCCARQQRKQHPSFPSFFSFCFGLVAKFCQPPTLPPLRWGKGFRVRYPPPLYTNNHGITMWKTSVLAHGWSFLVNPDGTLHGGRFA